MRSLGFGLLVLVALGLAPPAGAAEQWGTEVSVLIGDVLGSGGMNNFTARTAGGSGNATSQDKIDDALELDFRGTGPWDRGISQALAQLAPGSNQVPVLKSQSLLTGNTSNQSSVAGAVSESIAFASELFEYTGSTPGTLTLSFDLEAEVGNMPADPMTYARAEVAVFDEADYRFFGDLATLMFEFGATAKAFDDTSLQILDDTGGASESRSTDLMFDVSPGERFYVWERLVTSANRGIRYADAFNTLTGVFDRPELVVSRSTGPAQELQPGDSDQDLDFDQSDIVQVLRAGKYRTGQPATWGDGDWDGAPGGSPGNPPPGNGVFDQFDIIAAQQAAIYLSGPYAASSEARRALDLSVSGSRAAAGDFGPIAPVQVAVPEPSALVLLALGLLANGIRLRRHHRG